MAGRSRDPVKRTRTFSGSNSTESSSSNNNNNSGSGVLSSSMGLTRDMMVMMTRRRDTHRARILLFRRMFLLSAALFTLLSLRVIFIAVETDFSSVSETSLLLWKLPQRTVAKLNKTVAIGGLFRNNGVEDTFRMYRLMKDTASQFAHHALILLENDSTDGTDRALRQICRTDPHAICLQFHIKHALPRFLPQTNDTKSGPFSQKRFARMSWYRNIVLQEAKKITFPIETVDNNDNNNKEQPEQQQLPLDYFVFIDPDLFGEPWLPLHYEVWPRYAGRGLGWWPGWWGGKGQAWHPSSLYRAVQRADRHLADWSAVCFYGTFSTRLHQYDMLAFRLGPNTPIPPAARQYEPNWTWQDWNMHFSADGLENKTVKPIDLHVGMLLFNFYGVPEEHIPVRSCFGGLSVYKMERLRDCEYDELTHDCEHVSLNECLLEKYPNSVYMDPRSKVYYDFYAGDYDR